MSSTATLTPLRPADGPLVSLTVTRPPSVLPTRGRVVILSATVGQGHEGAARELARRLRQRGIEVAVHDYLDALPAAARHVLRDLYHPTVQYTPRLFDRIFRGMEHDGPLRAAADWVCAAAEDTVGRWARDADVVVTTYPLAGQTLGRLRVRGGLTARSATYLTDPAAHALWCHPAVDQHLTVTHATAVDAQRHGVSARAVGPLCAPGFDALDDVSRSVTRHAVRSEFGLAPDAPVVLVSAGSLGMGSVSGTVRHILGHPRAQVIALCGRNAGLRAQLARLDRVVALGWRHDVPALMTAADVLVHNAGGLSFTEALVAGLPAVTYRPIPGHGRANADVLTRAGIAPWPRTPEDLVATIDRLGPDAISTTTATTADRSAARAAAWPVGADPADAIQTALAAATRPGPEADRASHRAKNRAPTGVHPASAS